MKIAGFNIRLQHVHIFMACSALVVAYMLRVNLSVAIVAMTDKESANPNFPEFDWDEGDKSQILSSFFFGYLIFQIPFGSFAEKFGAKVLLSFAMTMCALLTLAVPFFAPYGAMTVCVLRAALGAFQGAFFPSLTVLVAKWVPPEDRGQAFNIVFGGSNFGTLVGLILSGYLASTNYGWPSVFYLTGALACIWVLIWLWVGASTPAEHTWISIDERNKIEVAMQHVSTEPKRLKTPWSKIVTSVPVWAILIAHLGQNWGFWTLLTEMPNYIDKVLGFNIKANGLLSSLPYLAGWIAAILIAWISKYTARTSMSRTVERKIWNTIGFWGCALALLILAVIKTSNPVVAICLLTLAVSLDSATISGFLTNHAALSPNFCGTLMGITNSLSNITSISAPLCVGFLVKDSSSAGDWTNVFLLSSAIMFATNLVYLIFGTSQIQPWNEPSPEEKNENGIKNTPI